jgi:uncharacterized membrane protein
MQVAAWRDRRWKQAPRIDVIATFRRDLPVNRSGAMAMSSTHSISEAGARPARPQIRTIAVADLRDVLARGFDDFVAKPTHIIFLGLIYPIVGLILARMTFGYEMLPLLFPLIAGFALVGPVAAVGLYELSRRREQGHDIVWTDALKVVHSPSIGAITILGAVLLAIFVGWMATALGIYRLVFGDAVPASVIGFATEVLTTPAGWTLIVVGIAVGFLFAALVLTISVVSFPLLLDRDVGPTMAVVTSVRAVAANPAPMAAWGLIVAAGLVVGSLPLFVGLAVVVPVLGHATWHLYRKVVAA